MRDLNFPNAISNKQDFFGRQEILERITQILLSKKRVPILVIGERCIGKTSLQNITVQQLSRAESAQFNVLCIEPRGITTFSQLAQAIVRRTANWVKNSAGIEISFPSSIATIEDFESALSNIFEIHNQDTLICIDEFDEIVRNLEHDLPVLYGMFHYLLEKTCLPIYFLFTMTHIPNQMEEEIPSTLVSISQIFHLPPLSYSETRQLTQELTKEHLSWSDFFLDELFRLSGGHPYFTKLILSYLPTESSPDHQKTTVTTELLLNATQNAIHDPKADHVMRNLFKIHFSPNEKEIILFLAQHNAPIQLSELRKGGIHWITQVKHLKKRFYVTMDPDEKSFDFKFSFMGEWLRNWIEFDIECEKFSELQKILSKPEIEVDDAVGVVKVKDQVVNISVQEYKIMHCLAANADQLVTRTDLMEAAWDTLEGVTDQTIDTAVYRLRKKLKDQGQYIETKPGQGYILHKGILLNNKNGKKNPT